MTDAITRPTPATISDVVTAADSPNTLTTRPPDPDPLNLRGRPWLRARYWWRLLTSMRTALLLLTLLAVAAIPGSVLPQRGINPGRVAMFLMAHRTLGPLLDRLSFFDVFRAPWFAAIYLLLMVSLVGCLGPRIRLHMRALRKPPPPTPRHLDRLAAHGSWRSFDPPEATVRLLARRLRRRRWRVSVAGTDVRAERGYLRETGNLVFHLSLLALLAGTAWGAVAGYQGDAVVVDGQTFSNTPVAYDTFHPGRGVNAATLAPFSVTLNRFTARYRPTGQPAWYDADVSWQPAPTAAVRRSQIVENRPLVTASNLFTGGTKVYLTGHGYAPHVTVTSRAGRTVFDGVVPFLPVDATTYRSTGVIKVVAAQPDQLGFTGFLLPTAQITPLGMTSTFPAPNNPRLVLTAYHGDLGLGAGQPQSVFTLKTARMTQYTERGQPARVALAPGQKWTLPDGVTIRFDDLRQFANLHVTYNPGKRLVLLATTLMVLGLIASLRISRQRLWLRVASCEGGSRVLAGGLARTNSAAFHAEFAAIVGRLSTPRTPKEQP